MSDEIRARRKELLDKIRILQAEIQQCDSELLLLQNECKHPNLKYIAPYPQRCPDCGDAVVRNSLRGYSGRGNSTVSIDEFAQWSPELAKKYWEHHFPKKDDGETE